MIVKKKTRPIKQIGLERFVQRLPSHHSRYSSIENALRTTRAGDNGEKILAGVFSRFQIPFQHYVFHDLNLSSTGKFQIDTLFLCRQGAVILEMKNIAGSISFPTGQNQITRTLENGQVDSFECPSIQLERNEMLLEDWFYARNMSVPIYKAVVFPRTQQHFESERSNLKILFPLEVLTYLRNIGDLSPTLDDGQLREISAALMESHRDYNPFPLISSFNISSSELKTGVQCEKCGLFGMESIHKGWGCHRCKYVSADAHSQSVLDYFMLVDNVITNRDCRLFLRLDSPQKANRILKRLQVPSFGDRKGRHYAVDLSDIELLENKVRRDD